MSIGISPIGRFWLGLGYAGFKLFTYAAGTTTKQNTFTDSTGATPNTNPIILDANGSAAVFLTQELLYKFVVASPTDSDPPTSPVWTQDNISSYNSSYTPPGNGAVTTTVGTKLAQIIAISDYAATDAGIANWIAELQSTGALGFIPYGTFTSTAPIAITAPVTILGSGVAPYVTALGTLGLGSWLHFAHLGQGFTINNAGALMSGVRFSGFGTYRDQTAPGGGWTPIAADFDIYANNTDLTLTDMCLLNPTKGVYLANGNAGRLTTQRLRGQPLQIGIQIDVAEDVCYLDQTHFWPFWSTDSNVISYMNANTDALMMGRCDNPQITNFFSIYARSGIRFYQNATGSASKPKLVNIDCDLGKYGIWIDNTVTNGVNGLQCVNFTHQGNTGLAGSVALQVDGNNSALAFVNFRTDYCNLQAVSVGGTGNLVTVDGNVSIYNWNQAASGAKAFDPAAGNTIKIGGFPIFGGGGAGAKYGSTGTIYVDDWQSYVPTVNATGGAITLVGAVVANFRRWNSAIDLELDITITTNGTGSGALLSTLPANAANFNSSLVGRSASTGKTLGCIVPNNGSTINIQNYDNTYPGADGAQVIVSGTYRTQ